MRGERLLHGLCRAVFALPVVTACNADADEPGAVERTDSAGVEIVTSSGPDHPLEWRIEEVLTIDSESEEAGVFQPSSSTVTADDAGRLYILDRGGSRVVVFDSTGRFLHSLGAKGGGPGEFDFPLALVVAPDGRAAIFDAAKRKLVWFASDGSILPETSVPDPFFGGTMRQTEAGLLYDRGRAGGAGIAMDGIGLAADGADAAVMLVERVSPPTKSIDLESCGMRFSGMGRIFEPSVIWDARETLVSAATNANYEIRVFDGLREVRRVRRAIEPRAATAELAAQELGEGMRISTDGGVRTCRTDEVVEQRGVAAVIPLILRVALTPDGGLWVQRRGGPGEEPSIDVFSPDGAYLGTLPASTPFPATFLPDRRFAGVATDELDVTRVVVLRVES